MNSLTVNLHLLMASFYRPTGERTRIVIEDAAFPSDGTRSPRRPPTTASTPRRPCCACARARARRRCAPRTSSRRSSALRGAVALVLLGGVNYLSGEVVEMAAVAAAGRRAGAVVGWDLAHAAGNVPLALHDWDVDFAAWCHYKYLNAGPGAPGGAFVHARHGDGRRSRGSRAGGATTRRRGFAWNAGSCRGAGAAGWQVSTPAVLAYAPVYAALAQLFDAVGIAGAARALAAPHRLPRGPPRRRRARARARCSRRVSRDAPRLPALARRSGCARAGAGGCAPSTA